MTTPDERADAGDRNAAIRLVDDALKAGRIVQADRDMRVEQLRSATTMQDIDLVVRDLRAPAAAGVAPSVTAVPARAGQPWPGVTYGPPAGETATRATHAAKGGGRAIGGIIAAVVLISIVVPIAGAIIAFASSRDSFDLGVLEPTDDTTYLPGQEPREGGINVHTVDGFNAMVEALREETGESFVYSAAIYPRYAVMDVPLGVNDRYQSFYWDGDLSQQNIRGTSTNEEFDLGLVRPEQMIELLMTVRDRVERPTSWYVVLSDHAGAETTITAHASNEFNESSYLVATLDGTIVYDSEQQG